MEVPATTPVTIPEPEPMVATVSVAELHTPPGGVQLSVVVAPAHTTIVPVIGVVAGVTVTTLVAVTMLQAPTTVYVIVSNPGDTPVTIPVPEPIDVCRDIVDGDLSR